MDKAKWKSLTYDEKRAWWEQELEAETRKINQQYDRMMMIQRRIHDLLDLPPGKVTNLEDGITFVYREQVKTPESAGAFWILLSDQTGAVLDYLKGNDAELILIELKEYRIEKDKPAK